jgi:hypothetical protein
MSVSKNCDAKVHLFAGRNKNRSTFNRAARANEAHPRDNTHERPRASRLTFVEDFMLEHSVPSMQITSIGMSGSF